MHSCLINNHGSKAHGHGHYGHGATCGKKQRTDTQVAAAVAALSPRILHALSELNSVNRS